jgi:hypothetical protein
LYDIILHAEFLVTTLPPDLLGLIYPPAPPVPSAQADLIAEAGPAAPAAIPSGFCGGCGTKNDGNKFCGGCGRKAN